MYSVTLTEKELNKVKSLAEQRFNSNRNAQNPTISMLPSKTDKCPWYSDIIGLIAEVTVAKYFSIPLNSIQWVYEQSEFNKIKNSVCDVAQCEVRSTYYQNGRLIVKPNDLKHKPETPFLFVIVSYDEKSNKASAVIKGWATPIEVVRPEYAETYFTTAYYLPNHLLHPLEELPDQVKQQVG